MSKSDKDLKNEEYKMVRIDIDDPIFIDTLAYIMSRSSQYLDIRMTINLDATASLTIGSYVDEKEDNVPHEATALKESVLTNMQLLERLGLRYLEQEKREEV